MPTSKLNIALVALFLVTGIWNAGCNVDGRWTQLQSVGPVSAIDRASAASDDDDVGADMSEVDLVEAVLAHRSQYRLNLQRLQQYYIKQGDATKANWAAFELKGLAAVKQFKYFLDAEIPPKDLKATERIPEADDLLKQGLALMKQGGHRIPALYREDRMVEAAGTLRTLIETYPTSDKIDDAAFYLGEIHRLYFPGEAFLAAQWYERAYSWDPSTPHPARFRAAVLYDENLRDRDRALEIYHGVLMHDQNAGHTRHATQRIHYLTDARWNSTERPENSSPR